MQEQVLSAINVIYEAFEVLSNKSEIKSVNHSNHFINRIINLKQNNNLSYEQLENLIREIQNTFAKSIVDSINNKQEHFLALSSGLIALIEVTLKMKMAELLNLEIIDILKLHPEILRDGQNIEDIANFFERNKDKWSNDTLKIVESFNRLVLIIGFRPKLELFDWFNKGCSWKGYEKIAISSLMVTKIDMYLMGKGLHYSQQSLQESINTYKSRLDFIEIGTDETIEYRMNNCQVFSLTPPTGAKKTDENKWSYSEEKIFAKKYGITTKLLTTQVTNCHIVIAYQAKTNRYWMLHVSPHAIKGKTIWNYAVKNAYLDLNNNYSEPTLGVGENDSIEIIVIDKRNGNFDPKKLKLNIKSEVLSIKLFNDFVDMPSIFDSEDETEHGYQVCFIPEENRLIAIKKQEILLEEKNLFSTNKELNKEENDKCERQYSRLTV